MLAAERDGAIEALPDNTAKSLFDHDNLDQVDVATGATGKINVGLHTPGPYSDVHEELTDVNLLVAMIVVDSGEPTQSGVDTALVGVFSEAGGFRNPESGQQVGLSGEAVNLIIRRRESSAVKGQLIEALKTSNVRYPDHPPYEFE